jgi:hypothetical protein
MDRVAWRQIAGDSLTRSQSRDRTATLKDGTPLAMVNHGKRRVGLTIENRRVPEFGGWLIVQLPETYASFRRRADG